jgi:S1-C subfamily serine protease
MEIDFTRDKMIWTPLQYTPQPPQGMGGRAGGGGGLEVIGSVMKMFGAFVGAKTTPDVVARGFLGFDVKDGDDHPIVLSVLDKGPAAQAGLKVGDVITRFADHGVDDRDDVIRLSKKLSTGKDVKLTIKRGDSTKELTLTTAEGL